MQNRKRAVQLIVRVTQEEKDHIYKNMALYGAENFNTYARNMLIDGYVVEVDTQHFQTLASEVNKIGVNINQITRIANTTGMVTSKDIYRIQELVREIWQLLKSSLSVLLSKGQ
ncbi:MAG: MobC family plasmid mobilization relaxosome protein [Defluviitaleaceae bacterium]|nr:MobC family plasmid mobilization relaxosome protein [Defluviitaleaceae bacterium]